MDLHDIWQENKRWILCCLLGLVIYWVGGYVVESVWSDQTVVRAIQRSQSQVQGDQYDQGALKAAKTESEALKAVRGRLAKALVFDPGDDFRLAGKGDPELWWDRRSRAVKEEVMSRADEEGVDGIPLEAFGPPLDWSHWSRRPCRWSPTSIGSSAGGAPLRLLRRRGSSCGARERRATRGTHHQKGPAGPHPRAGATGYEHQLPPRQPACWTALTSTSAERRSTLKCSAAERITTIAFSTNKTNNH